MILKKSVFLLLLIPLVSCSSFFKKKTERVLARVQDEYLYESDIKGLLLPGTSSADSVTLVRAYIDNWIRKQLLVRQARNHLTESDLDFSDRLAEYENALVIYAYEKALVDQKLDTIVTTEEIESYYNENVNNFLLKENIVKFRFVKLPLNSEQARQVRRLLDADDPVSLTRLSELCEGQAADYFLDNDNWFPVQEVLKEIPVTNPDDEAFLKSNRSMEYRDSSFIYIVRIRECKIKDNISPLSYEESRIRSMILNKRKIELINRMHEDVMKEAEKHNDFEIY